MVVSHINDFFCKKCSQFLGVCVCVSLCVCVCVCVFVVCVCGPLLPRGHRRFAMIDRAKVSRMFSCILAGGPGPTKLSNRRGSLERRLRVYLQVRWQPG